ncbi:nuclear transport factor 2 family protein [Paracidovorax valerianellae]|uniref:Predicted SnoaL-like aldol condensation-catalyzing enzyme n=1 Tax=Paracidovorax valerianellae TaxID=187868 RepID=A0A1G6I030_9BURK|nr:nuclear transport factor 2 family protein [Paracidovorax valerianellae]MDA8446975.1 nuclear transport factor 2 family protein [Paracidovorax valerianellae]SDB99909.1 Predicted SnoaL-like aldol condensation-catalyzing enzyme [Paracidovorax valerianellae]
MKKHLAHWIFALSAALPLAGFAQVPVQPAADQQALLASADPVLRANKRLVYDFWREVFEAGQVAQADKYVAESYVQHNPNVPTGRAAMVAFVLRRNPAPQPVEERIKAPLVSIVAERDMVILSFVREYPEPKDPGRKYTTTWFDMFRIESGKLAEHWDGAVKPVNP